MTVTGPPRGRLRNRTRAAHDVPDLQEGPFRPLRYRRLLGRFHGVHRADEPALSAVLDPVLQQGRCEVAAPGALDVAEGGTLGGRLINRPVRDSPAVPVPGHRHLDVYRRATGSAGGRQARRSVRKNAAAPSRLATPWSGRCPIGCRRRAGDASNGWWARQGLNL